MLNYIRIFNKNRCFSMTMAAQTRKYIPIFLDEVAHRQIRLYSVETGQSMAQVCKPLIDQFKEGSLALLAQIREMKEKAEQERLRQEEAQRIANENPMPVIGHEVEPIPAQ